MTQIIEPFLLWLGELIFLRLKELNFSSNMARRIELFLFCMSQRIGVFLVWVKELNFLIWVKEFNFSLNTTQRVAPFFFEYDAKSCTLFLWIRRKELNPFLWIWRKEVNTFFFHLTQRIEPFYQEVWLKELSRVSKKDSKNVTLVKGLIELNLFLWTSSQYDSKSWSLFFNMTRRIEPFLFSNMTQRIELFSKCSWNWTSLPYELLFYMTRSELFLDQYESKSGIFSQKKTQSVEPFRNMNTFLNLTERVELFFALDSKNWTFFQQYDSKNWALLCMSSKLNDLKKIHPKKCIKELNLFETWLIELNFFETKKTHRIEPFFSLTEVNPSFQHDSKNDFFLIDSKKLNLVSKEVSKSGTFFLILK